MSYDRIIRFEYLALIKEKNKLDDKYLTEINISLLVVRNC